MDRRAFLQSATMAAAASTASAAAAAPALADAHEDKAHDLTHPDKADHDWSKRNPKPGSMQSGDKVIGWGQHAL